MDSTGVAMHHNRDEILDHIVNHGTHHRGQITASMTAMKYSSDDLDLLFALNDIKY